MPNFDLKKELESQGDSFYRSFHIFFSSLTITPETKQSFIRFLLAVGYSMYERLPNAGITLLQEKELIRMYREFFLSKLKIIDPKMRDAHNNWEYGFIRRKRYEEEISLAVRLRRMIRERKWKELKAEFELQPVYSKTFNFVSHCAEFLLDEIEINQNFDSNLIPDFFVETRIQNGEVFWQKIAEGALSKGRDFYGQVKGACKCYGTPDIWNIHLHRPVKI